MRQAGRTAALLAWVLLLPFAASGQTAAPAQEPSEVDTLELAKLSPEELFLRASSAALQFEALREPSRKILVRDHERSLPYLVTRLDTDDARERHALENVLVRIGGPAVAQVTEALRREAARGDVTRGARLAATVLGRIGDSAAVAPLAELTGHRDWKVRGAAAGALGRIGTGDAVPALATALEDVNEVVRKSAAVALRRVAARAYNEENPDRGAAEALDERVVSSLVASLSDGSYAVRYGASDALAAMGGHAERSLLDVCAHEHGLARLMAARALGASRSRKALRPLTAMLDDADWTTRAFAAAALGAIGPDRRARRALEKLASSGAHPLVVAQAARALGADVR